MKERDFNDTQLAAAAGLSVDTIRRAKSGGKISEDAARRICKALNVPLDDVTNLKYQ